MNWISFQCVFCGFHFSVCFVPCCPRIFNQSGLFSSHNWLSVSLVQEWFWHRSVLLWWTGFQFSVFCAMLSLDFQLIWIVFWSQLAVIVSVSVVFVSHVLCSPAYIMYMCWTWQSMVSSHLSTHSYTYSVLYTASLSTVIKKHSILHHSYADDSQLQGTAASHQIQDLILSMQKCTDDMETWITVNKLKLSDNKTEAMVASSGRKSRSLSSSFPNSMSMTIGRSCVPMSDYVKNLGVTPDSHLTMETHISPTWYAQPRKGVGMPCIHLVQHPWPIKQWFIVSVCTSRIYQLP